MVKIYAPIKDTWSISNETLQRKRHTQLNFHIISKSYRVFFPSSDNFSLRMGYTCDSKSAFYFQLFLKASSTSANICVCIKNFNYKFWFKNNSCRSDFFYLPSYVSDLINATNENLEIEINGMYIVKRDKYPAFPSKICLNEKLWEENDTDFEIIVIDERKNEEKIQIHKKLLIAYSDVFERMFNSGMEESKTNTLKIIDFNAETVKLAVEFFYGNDILSSISFNDIFELLRFADKYFINTLTDAITTFIPYCLTPSTINQVSNYANASTSTKLQQICSDFITVLKETQNFTDACSTVKRGFFKN